MEEDFLATAGPTRLSDEIRREGGRQLIYHRSEEFKAIYKEAIELLKYLYQVKTSDVFILTSSGTGGMEASIVNTMRKGDEVIVVSGGKFGERWKELGKAYGLEVRSIDLEWGEGLDIRILEEELSRCKGVVKGVLVQETETSTGVRFDVEGIGELMKGEEGLLIVDGITGLGVNELLTEEWGIDVLIGGSQKGTMIGPGLSFLSFSKKAWEYYRRSDLPKFYFDLKREKKAQGEGLTSWTPNIGLIRELRKSLRRIRGEGLREVIKKHERIAESFREGVRGMGLEVFGESGASSLTAIEVPEGVCGKKLLEVMSQRYKVRISGGQGKLEGRIIRIGHLGYIQDKDILIVLQALEGSLRGLGYGFELGSGLKAAQKSLYEMKR